MRWFLLLAVLVPVAGVASWQLLPADRTGPSEAPTSLDASRVGDRREVQGIGYVEPVSEVRRLMLRTGGVIKRCAVEAGDTARAGETLMELDDATQRADVALARRHLELAQAQAEDVYAGVNPHRIRVAEQTVERLREKLRHCRSEADRYKRLVTSNSASSQEYQAAETLRRQTEAELAEQEAELDHLRHHVTSEQRAVAAVRVRQAESALRLAEERLNETRLVAPFDGTVLKVLKREGEGVRTFEPEAVLLFGDLSRLRVRAEIDERFVRDLTVGQSATVYGRNLGGVEHPGRVVRLERIMGDKTVFTRASSERKDLDVLQLLIEMDPAFTAPVGLQIDVKIEVGPLAGQSPPAQTTRNAASK